MRGAALLALAFLTFTMTSAVTADDYLPPGYYEQGDVIYFLATGAVTSGTMVHSPGYTFEEPLPFVGCAIAKLRPDKELGRLRMISLYDGVPLEVEVNDFDAHRQDMQGGIAQAVLIDGTRTHGGLIQHPVVNATLAAWGKGYVNVAGFPYTDPASGQADFAATFFVTDHGFRDDATGEVHNQAGELYTPGDVGVREDGDWEMHLRLESRSGTPLPPETATVSRPEGTPPLDLFMPTEDYREVFRLPNTRFGGVGQVNITSTAMAQAGDNDLTFQLRAPNGTIMATVGQQPALLADDSGSMTFPLDRFGEYALEVVGTVALSNYEVTVTLSEAPPLDVSIWWEEVALAYDGLTAQQVCQNAVGGVSDPVVASIDARPEPPQWPMTRVTLLSLGVGAAVLVTAGLMVTAWVAERHKRLRG